MVKRNILESLIQAHSEELESALWVGLRALEERINLQRRLAETSDIAGHPRSRHLFETKAAENIKHARLLRRVIEKLGK